MTARAIVLVHAPPDAVPTLRDALPGVEVRSAAAERPARGRAGGGLEVAVVWLGADPERGFRSARELSDGGARVVVVGPTKDADLILRAMRQGASEFVLDRDDAGLVKAVREQLRPAGSQASGVVACVFPAKGGVGATTIATNLAAALQRTGKRTALVDLDLNLGDVLSFLDLGGGFSLSDLVENMRRLDRSLLEASVLRHASGVHVLAQGHRTEEAERVDAAAIAALLDFLRGHYDAIVVDGLRTFDDLALSALDASGAILLVVTQEVPAVRRARRCVELLRELGHERLVRLVVNRHQRTAEVPLEAVADTVGLPVAATVANDYPSVVKALNKGVLLSQQAPRAPVTRELDALASLVATPDAEVEHAPRKSILQRFFAPKVSHGT